MISFTQKERLVLILLSISIAAGFLARYVFAAFPASQKIFNVANDYQEYLKLDVNRAKLDEFKAIPYLGEKLAKRIIAYRQEQGTIKRLEELQALEGVGAFKFQVIKRHLAVIP